MIQHHLESCESTQEVLKQYFEATNAPLLISTSEQTKGRGRMGNQWATLPNALAFSFTLVSHPTRPTLTSLEVGLALTRILKQHFECELWLKWPNDLINQKGSKVGGILLQNLKGPHYACGIGLNWSDPESLLSEINRSSGQYPAGTLFEEQTLDSEAKKEKSFLIANSILKEIDKLRSENFAPLWGERCLHLNKRVQIRDHEVIQEGIFVGIGELGEALLADQQGRISRVFSGSLFLI